jgi:hypothetical protein
MVRDGYDPRAMASMFTTLQRVSRLEGAGDIPEWASTHPDPGNRVEATQKRLDTLSVPLSKLRDGREEYMPVIAGMTYGEDPRQGYIEGNTFYHSGLKFKLELPSGWQAQNTPEALAAVSPEQDAMLRLTAPGKGTPDEASTHPDRDHQVHAASGDLPALAAVGLTAMARVTGPARRLPGPWPAHSSGAGLGRGRSWGS